jgi:hypothetical protein
MKKRDRSQRQDLVSDAILGAPEKMNVAEALENLGDAGIDADELRNRTYDKLCAVAQEIRLRNEIVPALLRKAIDDLRPASFPPKTQADLDRRADSTISRIIASTQAAFASTKQASAPVFSPSFRSKKKEKSIADQRIIDRLETELIQDLAREGDQD